MVTRQSWPSPLPASRDDLIRADAAREAAWRTALLADRGLRSQFITWVAGELETLRADHPARALELADLCLYLAAHSGNPVEIGLAQRGRAWALHNLNRFDEALAAYEEAGQRFAQADETVQQARTCIGKVWLLRYLGRYQDALDAAAFARPVLEAADRARDVGVLDLNVAPVYRRLGMTRRAVEINQQAAAAFARIGEEDLEASALMNAANALTDLDDITPAFDAYQQAAATYERLQRHQRTAMLQTNLGELHQKVGQLDEALLSLSKAAAVAREHGLEREEAFAHAALSRTYGSLNLLKEALDHNRRAAAYFHGKSMVLEEALADADAADYAFRSGQAPEARRLASEAAAKFRERGNTPYMALAQVSEAAYTVEETPEAAELALALCREARTLLRQAGWLGGEARARQTEGELLERTGRSSTARRAYQLAAAIAERSGILPLAFSANLRLGRSLHTASPQQALHHYQQAAAYLETARKVLPDMELRQTFLADKASLFEHIVELHLRDGSPEAVALAFEAVERSKSRALLDVVSGPSGDAIAAASSDASAEVSDLRHRLAWFYSKLEQAGVAPEEVRQAREELRRLEDELAQRERSERTLRGRDATGTEEVASIDDLKRLLAPGDLLLEYFVADDEVLCFAVTNEGIQVHRGLASYRQVKELAEHHRFLMSAFPLAATLSAEARVAFEDKQHMVLWVLYNALLAKLPADWRTGRLIIVPHGLVHTVPFHALWDGATYVADHAPVLVAPSASVLTTLHERARGSVERPLVVAPENPDLPAVQEEARLLASLFPSAAVLARNEATIDQFRRATPSADVLHLATHATFRDDNPMFSGLRLTDQWLLLRDVPRLQLAAWLTVLSACNTGRQQVNPGDELIGLAQAFFQAGCRSLVASLWPVADEIVPAFMERFYAEARAGRAVDAAVQQAQLAVRERYPNPFFWAPFAAYGQR